MNNVSVKVSCSMHESTGIQITVVFTTCYSVPVNRLNTSIFIFIMSSSSYISLHVE